MRVPIIAGNWKMHKTVAESVDFVKKIKDQLPPAEQLETALAVSYTHLTLPTKA